MVPEAQKGPGCPLHSTPEATPRAFLPALPTSTQHASPPSQMPEGSVSEAQVSQSGKGP